MQREEVLGAPVCCGDLTRCGSYRPGEKRKERWRLTVQLSKKQLLDTAIAGA